MEQKLGVETNQLDINIRKMALAHLLLKGCVDCALIKVPIDNLAADSVQRGLTVAETLDEFRKKYDGKCNGQVPAKHPSPDGCMPPLECGHTLGKAIGLLWEK